MYTGEENLAIILLADIMGVEVRIGEPLKKLVVIVLLDEYP